MVMACHNDMLRDIQDRCPAELTGFSACLKYNNMEYPRCRTEQAQFNNCAAAKK
jgi:hypothetical protein